jgi:hypothetical protein
LGCRDRRAIVSGVINTRLGDNDYEDAAVTRDGPAWEQWQAEVVSLLRGYFAEALNDISLDDVDWLAWRTLYVEGRSPEAAVARALERDL